MKKTLTLKPLNKQGHKLTFYYKATGEGIPQQTPYRAMLKTPAVVLGRAPPQHKLLWRLVK